MERGTRDEPKFGGEHVDTVTSVQSLAEKLEQLCHVKDDRQNSSDSDSAAAATNSQLAAEISLLSLEERRVLKTEMIFPALSQLQDLTLDGGSLPLAIFRQLLRITGHVSPSSSSSTSTGAHVDGPFVSSLKSLSVEPCPQNYFAMITDNQFQWHLTLLCLNLPGCSFTEWPSVFTALKNKFGKTLIELRLTLPKLASRADGDRILEESKRFKVHFPHLLYLELAVGVETLAGRDFFLRMKDYNRVRIIFKGDVDEPNVDYSKTDGWSSSSSHYLEYLDSVLQTGGNSDDFSDDENLSN